MECYSLSSKHIGEVLINVSDISSCVEPNKKERKCWVGFCCTNVGPSIEVKS